MAGGLATFLAAIRQQESGGDYQASNPSGASGAYQFEFSTWQSALALAGLANTVYYREPAASAPPSVQDTAAGALMMQYYNEFGQSWYNVAEAWYGGPGAVGHPEISGGAGYPTVGEYAANVIAIYNQLSGGVTVAVPTGVPTLIAPMTDQFAADIGYHYSSIVEPVWATWAQYAGLTLTNLVTPPTALV